MSEANSSHLELFAGRKGLQNIQCVTPLPRITNSICTFTTTLLSLNIVHAKRTLEYQMYVAKTASHVTP